MFANGKLIFSLDRYAGAVRRRDALLKICFALSSPNDQASQRDLLTAIQKVDMLANEIILVQGTLDVCTPFGL